MSKPFDAAVHADAAAFAAVTLGVPGDLPVLVSEPVAWNVEYRFFVRHGAVVAGSVYFRHGELVVDWQAPLAERDAAAVFAAQVLAQTKGTLRGGVVLDVGAIAGLGWAVVEANPAWASGLYGCDPESALLAVVASVCARAESVGADAAFARAVIVIET